MQFIQWSKSRNLLLASCDYGIVDGDVMLCVGDNPDYATEGYPAISKVPEGGRLIACMPNAWGWWRAWSYRRPEPAVFEVADNATVYVGRTEGAVRPIQAKDAVAELERMLQDAVEGAQFYSNFEVYVPLAALPSEKFPRSYRPAKGYRDIALAIPGILPVAAIQSDQSVGMVDYQYMAEQWGYPEKATLLMEADRLGIDFNPYGGYIRLDAWNIGINYAYETTQQKLFELSALVRLVNKAEEN